MAPPVVVGVMGLEDQARRVVASLEERPGLFYEILRIVAEEYEVVGPWVEEDLGWARRGVRGGLIVCATPAGGSSDWSWEIEDGPGGRSATVGEAKAAADEVLKESGCLLAG